LDDRFFFHVKLILFISDNGRKNSFLKVIPKTGFVYDTVMLASQPDYLGSLQNKNSFVKQERRMVTKNTAELKLLREGTL
jgi:hypothetical protein